VQLTRRMRQRRFSLAVENIEGAVAVLGEVHQDDGEREIADARTEEIDQVVQELERLVDRIHQLSERDPVTEDAYLTGRN
jgi:hypothetical protein